VAQAAPLTERKYALPFVLVTSLFFLWSIGVNLNDVLIPHLKKAFDLTDFQSSFIQVAFFGGVFPRGFSCRAIDGENRLQKGILLGLLICAMGTLLFLPAASSRTYGFFLAALFVMSSRAILFGSGRQSLCDGSRFCGKFGAPAESGAIVQRGGSGACTDAGSGIHSFGHRIFACTKGRDVTSATASLCHLGNEPGQSALFGDHWHLLICRGADLLCTSSGGSGVRKRSCRGRLGENHR